MQVCFSSFASVMLENILSLNKLFLRCACWFDCLIIECLWKLGIIGDISFHLRILSIWVILVLLNLFREKDVIVVTSVSFPKGHFQTSPSMSVDDSDLLKAKEGELVFSVSFVIRFLYSVQLRCTNIQWKIWTFVPWHFSAGLLQGYEEEEQRGDHSSQLGPRADCQFQPLQPSPAWKQEETKGTHFSPLHPPPCLPSSLTVTLPQLFTQVVKSSRMHLP